MGALGVVPGNAVPPVPERAGGMGPAGEQQPEADEEADAGVGGELVAGDEGTEERAAVRERPPPVEATRAGEALKDADEREAEAGGDDDGRQARDLHSRAGAVASGHEEGDVAGEQDEGVARGMRVERGAQPGRRAPRRRTRRRRGGRRRPGGLPAREARPARARTGGGRGGGRGRPAPGGGAHGVQVAGRDGPDEGGAERGEGEHREHRVGPGLDRPEGRGGKHERRRHAEPA